MCCSGGARRRRRGGKYVGRAAQPGRNILYGDGPLEPLCGAAQQRQCLRIRGDRPRTLWRRDSTFRAPFNEERPALPRSFDRPTGPRPDRKSEVDQIAPGPPTNSVGVVQRRRNQDALVFNRAPQPAPPSRGPGRTRRKDRDCRTRAHTPTLSFSDGA
jgi:hypothetical protein